jgi:hypothetical protein
MTKKQHDQKSHQVRSSEQRAVRKTDWDDAEIVIDIKHTMPGAALDNLLRTRQTRVLLELLSASREEAPGSGSDGPSWCRTTRAPATLRLGYPLERIC